MSKSLTMIQVHPHYAQGKLRCKRGRGFPKATGSASAELGEAHAPSAPGHWLSEESWPPLEKQPPSALFPGLGLFPWSLPPSLSLWVVTGDLLLLSRLPYNLWTRVGQGEGG